MIHQHPIAAAAHNVWSREYNFPLDLGVLLANIQKRPLDAPRSEMTSICDLVSFLVECGISPLPGYHSKLPSRRPNVKFKSGASNSNPSKPIRGSVKAADDKLRKEHAERHLQWKAVDTAVASEFEKLAQLGFSESHSCEQQLG